MFQNQTKTAELRYDRLSIIPLGGQGEIGQVLWIVNFGDDMILVDAGAAYPSEDLPGVDLLLPNTSFLEANQDRIRALILTNGHEEHCGAVNYLLSHVKIPRIMAPPFVASLISQRLIDKGHDTVCDTIRSGHVYHLGCFELDWIPVNDAIADACALHIGTPAGSIIYTSSFKLDQTPVDKRLLDLAALARAGEEEVLLLISDSAGVEAVGYSQSEKSVAEPFIKCIKAASGRVFVVVPGANTHRLQILFSVAEKLGRKVVLLGEELIQTTVAAVMTGNLSYDRKLEATVEDLKTLANDKVLVIGTGAEGDPLKLLDELAYGKHSEVSLKSGDTVIYSAEIYPGRSRHLAMILDQFLALNIWAIYGIRGGVHVSNHAGREELKLMLTVVKPKYFLPAFGEGRHIMAHARLASDWGVPEDNVFPLQNGSVLELTANSAFVAGSVEAQAVLYNRDQDERVTSSSVNERRVLSSEGVFTVGIVLNDKGKLVSEPIIEADASGFLLSEEWAKVKPELITAIKQCIVSAGTGKDVTAMRSAVRELVNKTLRSRLQSKPLIQVIVHSLDKAVI